MQATQQSYLKLFVLAEFPIDDPDAFPRSRVPTALPLRPVARASKTLAEGFVTNWLFPFEGSPRSASALEALERAQRKRSELRTKYPRLRFELAGWDPDALPRGVVAVGTPRVQLSEVAA
jgi:hypothetical protein